MTITFDLYGHLMPGAEAEAAELNRRLRSALTPRPAWRRSADGPARAPLDRAVTAFAEKHLLYEVGTLHTVTGKLMNRHHKDDPAVENALLESFGVHARNLIDFVWVEHPKVATDAVAGDYVDDWEPPEQSERLSRVKDRVGKEIAHLSYHRLDISEEQKGSQVIGIGPELLSAFGSFAERVPDERVPHGWRERAYVAAGVIPRSVAEDLLAQSVATQGLPPSQ